MLRIILGAFVVLHGLVHLLYLGQSLRFFELQSGLVWPDGSWAFSKLLGNGTVRQLASFSLGLAALGFVIAGAGIFLRLDWWLPVLTGSAVFSTAIYLVLWDGSIQRLDDKGGVGLLINLAILAGIFLFGWPNLQI